ncbi:MAG TPA: hypothetical protein PLU30_01750 [Verrucomicrobiae bacterium]|nr:hypothetical protein [Verrucomicrobiae bacterium]
MSWASDNAEKLVLSGALLALAATASLCALKFSTSDEIRGAAARTPKSAEGSFEVGQYAELAKKLTALHPWQQPESGHRLFISRFVRWDAKSQRIRVYDPREPLDDGIPPIWKQKYGFPVDDVNVQSQDPDQDGFNNKEEYTAQTDPVSKDSHPPFITKLKVLQYNPKPFNIDVRSYQELDGQMTVMIELPESPDPRKKRVRVRKGDTFFNWTVQDFRKSVKKMFNPKVGAEIEADESELDISNDVTGEKVTVIFKKKFNAAIHEGTLAYLIDKSQIPVSKGREFEFLGAKYRLLSIDANGAKVGAVEGGKEENLQPCTQEDLVALGLAAAPGAENAEGDAPAAQSPPGGGTPPVTPGGPPMTPSPAPAAAPSAAPPTAGPPLTPPPGPPVTPPPGPPITPKPAAP